MVLQSKRVWIGGQFVPCQLVLEAGKVERILPYGTQRRTGRARGI